MHNPLLIEDTIEIAEIHSKSSRNNSLLQPMKEIIVNKEWGDRNKNEKEMEL